MPNEQVLDWKWYDLFARNIAKGDGYSANGIPTGYWPIGYPGLLGGLYFVVGESVLAGKVLNIILYLCTIVLTYRLSQMLFHAEYAARVTLCLLCFYPNHIAYTALLGSEILFVFWVALSAFTFIKARTSVGLLALSGVFWGLATLTKPYALILPFLFAVLFAKTMRSFLKSAVLVYCMLLLTISPWLVRNYSTFGVFSLAHTGGINLLDGNNPYATGSGNFDENTNSLLGDLKTVPHEHMIDGREAERDAMAARIALDYIVHNPGRVLTLLPLKFWHTFRSDTDGIFWALNVGMAVRSPMFIPPRPFVLPSVEGRLKIIYDTLRNVAHLHYLLLILLFTASLTILLRIPIGEHHIGLGIILLLTLVCLALFGVPRYHFPMMPWVAIYSGIGAQVLRYGKDSVNLLETKSTSLS